MKKKTSDHETNTPGIYRHIALNELMPVFLYRAKDAGQTATFHLQPFPYSTRIWYVILQGSDTLIYQPFIPAIGGRRTFPTETQAKNTGQLVVQKLSEGKSPTLTREEVQNCLNKNSH